MPKKLSIFVLFVLLACGRTILNDPAPTYSVPLITAIGSSSQGTTLKIKIDWNFPVAEEAIIQGFKLERSENNGDFTPVNNKIDANLRSFEFTEIARNNQVSYRISTVSEQNAQTSLLVSYFVPPVAFPVTYCNLLTATLIGGNNGQPKIYLSWNNTNLLANYTGVFQVLRSTTSAPIPQVIATTPNKFYLDENITTFANYTYSIRPPSVNTCSSNSIPILAVASPLGQCPSDLQGKIIQVNGLKSVVLTWKAQLADFVNFSVRRADSPTGTFTTVSPNDWAGKITVFQDRNDGEKGKAYYYKIISTNTSNPPASCESNLVKVQF